MPEIPEGPPLDQYQGYLVCLVRSLWDESDGPCDVSDLVQQTLLEAHAKRFSFRGESSAQFAAWLRAILANNVRDVIRARRRAKNDVRRERPIEELLDESSSRLGVVLTADDSSPSDRAAEAEQLCRLADALARLEPPQQEAVILHHIRGQSLADTAREMGRSVNSVAGLLRRGLKGLRELMGDQG